MGSPVLTGLARCGSPCAAATPHAPSTLEELRGRPVGTIPGTLSERRLRRWERTCGPTTGARRIPTEISLLGRTDAVLLESPVALYYGDLPGLVTLEANSARPAMRR